MLLKYLEVTADEANTYWRVDLIAERVSRLRTTVEIMSVKVDSNFADSPGQRPHWRHTDTLRRCFRCYSHNKPISIENISVRTY